MVCTMDETGNNVALYLTHGWMLLDVGGFAIEMHRIFTEEIGGDREEIGRR